MKLICSLSGLLLLSACGGAASNEIVDPDVSETEAAATTTGLFSNVLDRNSVGWASVRGLGGAAFHDDWVARRAAGYMLIDLEVDELNGNESVSGVWQQNADGRNWASWRNLSSDEFGAKWQELRDAGYLLIDQETYVLAGTRYYAGIWIENKEGLSWGSYRNMTSAEYQAKYDSFEAGGYIPIDVDVYLVGGELRYSFVWVKNTEGLRWVMKRDLTASSYASYFDQYRGTYRVLDLESYKLLGLTGAQRYAAIWVENKNRRGWAAYRDMSATGFVNRWKQMDDAGYRLTDFDVYDYAGGVRYSGVWRQNNDRATWIHKDAVDAILDDAKETYDIPGMSVAVIKRGQFVYLAGRGYADIDNGKAAHSKTVMRLASVSKAVAGALAVDLEERGLVDLTRRTRDYVPSLPSFHTHRVWHTLTNRSGIGHYDELGSPDDDDHFNTAFLAMDFFVDEPLVASPGTMQFYSTHAYTVAGAALEAAMGTAVSNIVRNELTNRYDLDSLRPESLTSYVAERSKLYEWDGSENDEVDYDDLSWKVLGGGLESSAYDLARFGNKLVLGQILGPTALDKLWTAPDSLGSYAYGWSTGNDQCTRVVAKDGAQRGSLAYLRIYPDKDIVIAVLTNRQNGGHSAVNIGRAIGTRILTTECP